MAERKFTKGCPEWLMFQDFYRFVQSYYLPENREEYWISCIDSISELFRKHKNVPLTKHILLGFLNYIEEASKGECEKEWTCPACGKFRNPHDRFCRHCGDRIEREGN